MSTKTQNIEPAKKQGRLGLLLDAESLEPSLTWGLRMAIATTAPVVWGVATGRLEEAEWIALTADCIGWIALKGNASQRFRLLFAAAALCLLFTWVGSISGASVVWSIGLMIVVAFISGLFKNLGERGSGLALCLYVMFIIANAYPVQGEALHERMVSVAVGGVWNAILGMATIVFIPQQTPYRRSIALIWQKVAALMQSIAAGWNGNGIRSSIRKIFLAEQAVMNAISSSMAFYEKAIYQLSGKEHTDEYKLAQVRKAANLIAATMEAMAGDLENVQLHTLSEDARLRISGLMTSLNLNLMQMSTVSLSGRQEDELLMEQTLQQLQQRIEVLAGFKAENDEHLAELITNIGHLAGRCYKLLSRSLELLSRVEDSNVFRSYSILKTAYVLHPKHWWLSIRILFSFDSHTTRFVLRSSLASGLAIAIDKIFDLQRGYWLPFTVIIVLQPYFIATFKKAIDRILGTVAGGMIGGLILMIPRGLYLKEVMLFLSAIAMIHFYKASYRV
ncbi:MAG: FUSC family protein, partial [Chitinophagaceae bacterium]